MSTIKFNLQVIQMFNLNHNLITKAKDKITHKLYIYKYAYNETYRWLAELMDIWG